MRKFAHLAELADKNAALIDTLAFNPQTDDPFLLDTADNYRMTGLFSDRAVDEIFHETPVTPDRTERVERLSPAIGMLLVRPDMLHIVPKVEDFIRDRFRLIESAPTVVTPDMYWQMYKEAILIKEGNYSRLTRAAVYINSPSRLLIFEKPDMHTDETPLADHVYAHLKGAQGVQQSGTLRGEYAWNGAIEAGMHTLEDPGVALATDPFGAYRKIVRTIADGRHAPLRYPLLFFTGVGIHIPNYEEIQRDLPLFKPNGEDERCEAC